MATIAQEPPRAVETESFYFRMAAAMAAVIVLGFSVHLALGRSTFAAAPIYHLHALVFMGWTAIFIMQSALATRGPAVWHRRLGRIAALWVMLMIAFGFAITIHVIQRGTAPFFFQPQHFLIANPLNLLCFGIVVAAALRLRRQSDWHRRLQLCAMATIMGPAFGRLLPMPFLTPYAWDLATACGLIFVAIGAVRDRRREGCVHPAWWWGMLGVVAAIPAARLIAFTPLGDVIYAWVTAGHPGAALPGLAFGAPPPI